MSPASSGALEVERYIGACLISSNNHQSLNRKKPCANGTEKKSFENSRYQRCPDVFGGIPLVYPTATANRRSKGGGSSFYSTSLSKLAVHTHGVPLILTTNSSHPSSNSQQQSNNLSYRNSNSMRNKREYHYNHQQKSIGQEDSVNNNDNNKNVTADSSSVTSDSSSISSISTNSLSSSSSCSTGTNPENTCLPRIIKPRKRRKKDRKPHLFNSTFMQSSQLSSQARIMPYFLQAPLYSLYHHHAEAAVPFNSQFPFEEREETPNLQHSFDDLDDFDLNGNQTEPTSSTMCCQCRYCEPEGIWDFEYVRNNRIYARVDEDYSKNEDFVNDKVTKEEDYYDKHCFSRRLESSVSVDSQSSSLVDSLSSLSLDDTLLSPSSSPRVSRDLEVSTEIVTSMTGQHRDLEIKFFSTIVQQEN